MSTNDLDARLRTAVLTLAMQRARNEIKDALRRKGAKLSMIPYAEIQATARARLAAHHARLIPEVIPMIKEMLKEGFFGKKAKREWAQHANISSDAQSPAIVPQQQSLCRTYVRIGGRNDDCWIRPR